MHPMTPRAHCTWPYAREASKSLNQIVLKFPSILKAFEEIRGIFHTIDTDQNGAIERWGQADISRPVITISLHATTVDRHVIRTHFEPMFPE